MCNFYLASFSYGHCYFYVHSTKELIKRRLIQNFNIPAGATTRVFELLKIGNLNFRLPSSPPPPTKIAFKCSTQAQISIQESLRHASQRYL